MSIHYLSLLQGDLALFLAADERPVTLEHLIPCSHQVSKGCWEETDPVLNYPLKKKSSDMWTRGVAAQDIRGLQTRCK